MGTQIPQVGKSLSLKIACGKADTISGVATILIKIPTGGRYVSGGNAWFSTNLHKDDKVSIFISDEDDVLGFGAGAIVGSYTDSDVPEANRGWYIPLHSKEIEATPIIVDDLGIVPADLYLKIVGTKGDLALSDTFYVNLRWASAD